jgi:2'-5' RNA ligase
MPFAFTLGLDCLAAAAVEDMWRTLDAEGIDDDRHRLGYTPHITLAIYPDEAPVDRLADLFDRVAASWPALPVTLCGFGVFPAAASVLWLVPVVTADLLARHATIGDGLPDLPVHSHYRTDNWMPHITLSGAIQHPDRAIAALLPRWQPVSGFLDRADLVRFRPVEVLRSRALRPIVAD